MILYLDKTHGHGVVQVDNGPVKMAGAQKGAKVAFSDAIGTQFTPQNLYGSNPERRRCCSEVGRAKTDWEVRVVRWNVNPSLTHNKAVVGWTYCVE